MDYLCILPNPSQFEGGSPDHVLTVCTKVVVVGDLGGENVKRISWVVLSEVV